MISVSSTLGLLFSYVYDLKFLCYLKLEMFNVLMVNHFYHQEQGESIVKKINAVYLFKVFDHGVYNRPTPKSKYAFWLVDLKNGSGSIRQVDKSGS